MLILKNLSILFYRLPMDLISNSMKKTIFLWFLFLTYSCFSQKLVTAGEYEGTLSLAYNPDTHMVTGYYENQTGVGVTFSCIFYLEGTVTGNQFKIRTYFPRDKTEDLIEGDMELVDLKTLKIKLPQEHGGCWNVEHFSDEPVVFTFAKPTKWIQINYISNDKVSLYRAKNKAKKMKSYLVKNDIVYIERIEDGWAYASYFGKRTVKGWIKVSDLNKLCVN